MTVELIEPLAVARLHELFRYDPMTGKLFWRQRADSEFAAPKYAKMWNGKYPGVEAGTVSKKDGYRYLHVDGKRFVSHRAIWAMAHDVWPSVALDHIDHDRTNNRLDNLRAAGYEGNALNRAMKSDNTSGYTGVDPRPNGRFHARIQIRGVKTYLGTFDTIEEAAKARTKAEENLGFSNTHGRPLDV